MIHAEASVTFTCKILYKGPETSTEAIEGLKRLAVPELQRKVLMGAHRITPAMVRMKVLEINTVDDNGGAVAIFPRPKGRRRR